MPVGHVTNGVHVPSWDSAEADELWTQACGAERWARRREHRRAGLRRRVRRQRSGACAGEPAGHLIEYARTRLARQLAAAGAAMDRLDESQQLLDPERTHAGLRPALRDVQAAEPAAPRPGAPAAPLERPGATGPAHHGRQGPPRRRLGPGHDPRVAGIHPTPEGRRGVSCSSPTTTCSWPSSWSRVWTSGSTRRGAPGRPAARAA